MKEAWTLEVILAISLKGLKNKIHTAVRRNLEEIFEVKKKHSSGFKCKGPEIGLQFCSILGCVHFSATGTDKEK